MLSRNLVVCAVLSCWAIAFVAGDANARELRLSHQLPEADAGHRAARVLAAEMKKRVPGLPVTVHPNASLVKDPPQQYEAMMEGKIEMAIYPMGYASAKFPELSIVTLPGVPSSAEAA